MDSSSEHQTQALKLLQAFEQGTPESLEDLIKLFSPTANFFMWGPHKPPMTGHDGLREGFGGMFRQLEGFRYSIKNVAENQRILFIERSESFTFKGTHKVEVSLVSVSELGPDGKFVSWTDYFDSSVLTGLS